MENPEKTHANTGATYQTPLCPWPLLFSISEAFLWITAALFLVMLISMFYSTTYICGLSIWPLPPEINESAAENYSGEDWSARSGCKVETRLLILLIKSRAKSFVFLLAILQSVVGDTMWPLWAYQHIQYLVEVLPLENAPGGGLETHLISILLKTMWSKGRKKRNKWGKVDNINQLPLGRLLSSCKAGQITSITTVLSVTKHSPPC